MECTCECVDDGEGGRLTKLCPIHRAGPDLLRALMDLLEAIADREDKALIAREEMTPEQIYQKRLTEARKLVRSLAALYFERPRGIGGIPDAGPPDRR